MTAEHFRDANMLLYACSKAPGDAAKKHRAQEPMIRLAAEAILQPVTLESVISALRLRRRYQFSIWDSTILAAVLELGCSTLYSEEFSHGQRYDGVTFLNPLRSL